MRLIIGSGKLALHLKHWWTLKGTEFTSWSRQSSKDDLTQKLSSARIVYLAVSDDAILPVYRQAMDLIENQNVDHWVHFSGALSVKGILGAHPLMTFGPATYSELVYDSVPFALDWCQESGPKFSDLFPKHPNHLAHVPAEYRALYHSLIVLLGNLPSLMLREFTPILIQKFGFAVADLEPYLTMALKNSLQDPQSSVTGPWIRNDQSAIAKHLVALKDTKFLDFYEASRKTFSSRSKNVQL